MGAAANEQGNSVKDENETPDEAAKSEDVTQRSPDGFRRFIAELGLVRLLIASFLTWGLLFAERPEGDTFPNGFLEGAGCGLFFTASWLLTASGLLLASRRRRLRQAYRSCRAAACVSLLLCLFTFALRDTLDPETVEPPPLWGAFAMGAVALVFLNWGSAKHVLGAAKSSEPSPGSPLLHAPKTLLDVLLIDNLVRPAFSLLFLVFSLVGSFYVAERVGTCFADPKLGGRGVLLFLFIAPFVFSMEDWIRCENERSSEEPGMSR